MLLGLANYGPIVEQNIDFQGAQADFGQTLNFFIHFSCKSMVLGSLRVNIILKLVGNIAGVILKILEIHTETFFDTKEYMLDI